MQPPRGVVVVVFAVVVVARCRRGSTVAGLSKPPSHVQGIRDQDVYAYHGERLLFHSLPLPLSFSLGLARHDPAYVFRSRSLASSVSFSVPRTPPMHPSLFVPRRTSPSAWTSILVSLDALY